MRNTQNYWETETAQMSENIAVYIKKGNNFFKEPLFPYHNVK
uniref:Uncharacterized protein n=1 Tax=Anguilla anguilla TaxID=7936 RepID=A0A0E9R3N9_ANGAN